MGELGLFVHLALTINLPCFLFTTEFAVAGCVPLDCKPSSAAFPQLSVQAPWIQAWLSLINIQAPPLIIQIIQTPPPSP